MCPQHFLLPKAVRSCQGPRPSDPVGPHGRVRGSWGWRWWHGTTWRIDVARQIPYVGASPGHGNRSRRKHNIVEFMARVTRCFLRRFVGELVENLQLIRHAGIPGRRAKASGIPFAPERRTAGFSMGERHPGRCVNDGESSRTLDIFDDAFYMKGLCHARVAELVDALALGASGLTP